jgi:hypothetical protein
MPPGLVWPLGLISLTSSPPGDTHCKILTPENPRSIWVREGPWNVKIRKTGFSCS